jgi:hypothetical protein
MIHSAFSNRKRYNSPFWLIFHRKQLEIEQITVSFNRSVRFSFFASLSQKLAASAKFG